MANADRTAIDPWLAIERERMVLRCSGMGDVLAVDVFCEGLHVGGLALTGGELQRMTELLRDDA